MIRLLPWLLVACQGSDEWSPKHLQPYPNPYGQGSELWAPQPDRDNPLEVGLTEDAVYVSLSGSHDDPGHHVARVDRQTHKIRRIDTLGRSPAGLAVHPSGRWLVVFNRFSNFATLLDARSGDVIREIPSAYYAVEGVFTPDGSELWVTNRWSDTVEIWPVRVRGDDLEIRARNPESVAVGNNPRDLAISADGQTVAVASLTAMSVALIDVRSRAPVQAVDLGSPANGVAFAGDFAIVPTTSASTHHQPFEGPDTDGDGLPGDGTPNINFQDLQNDIAVIDRRSGEVVWRYTSDSLCCRDFRDVDPADLDRFGDLLPDAELQAVGGALPEQVTTARTADGWFAWVTYSASNQVQRFAVDLATGALSAEPAWATAGHNPHGIAVDGGELFVAHRLGETLGEYASSGELRHEHVVGDIDVARFPATDAEIGELFNFVTAPFTVDGDQSCTHCHREGGNIDKAFSMPLTAYDGVGSRMTMAYRGAADTVPWFMEAAFDHTNFKPVMNEFARIENFCCNDYTLFPEGAPADCAENPPLSCAEPLPTSPDGVTAVRGSPDSPAHSRPMKEPTRDAFYLARSEEIVGRTESFGDSVMYEDPITGGRMPLPLNFDGITRALGVFLLMDTHLLPNPNRWDTDRARRGQALFESTATGCAICHPAPTFAISTDNNPGGLPLRMGPVVSPVRDEDGRNLDLFALGFVEAFPLADMEVCVDLCDPAACDVDNSICDAYRDVRFGVPSLRGLWDRSERMLHDGRAHGLREVLCTPGHPALLPGEVGFNELDGIPDSHGGTSHLSAEEIGDLIAYIETM